VDEIDGLAPAIAIKQKNSTRNPRSTVATATEIYDYLRLLYARCGTVTASIATGWSSATRSTRLPKRRSRWARERGSMCSFRCATPSLKRRPRKPSPRARAKIRSKSRPSQARG
jgi:hypothetical protein